jgi:hypothetical protein
LDLATTHADDGFAVAEFVPLQCLFRRHMLYICRFPRVARGRQAHKEHQNRELMIVLKIPRICIEPWFPLSGIGLFFQIPNAGPNPYLGTFLLIISATLGLMSVSWID